MFDLTALPDGFHDNPYPHYAKLREVAPVCPQPNGSFVLSSYADLDRALSPTKKRSSGQNMASHRPSSSITPPRLSSTIHRSTRGFAK